MVAGKPPGGRLVVFDPNITRRSPAGSCLLVMLQRVICEQRVDLFVSRTDLPDSTSLRKVKVPTPERPVFLSSFLFTVFSICAYLIRGRRSRLKISTEGAFPFCDICYAHSCHHLLLFRYRDLLGRERMRRIARIMAHTWGAITERIAFRHARMIVVPSHGLARDLESIYPELVEGKIRIIPNPVDTDAFAPPREVSKMSLRKKLGIGEDAFLLSFCALGNFERKGLRLIFEALQDLQDSRIHLLVIGGSEAEISTYGAIAEGLAIVDCVHFAGMQNDIQEYLWVSNVFVFPSAYEGFPLVALQAAAAGLPLIATPVNGIEEFMTNGVTGWIVDRTRESIAAAIAEAVEGPARAAEMGEAARVRVQGYGLEVFRNRWVSLLEEQGAAD